MGKGVCQGRRRIVVITLRVMRYSRNLTRSVRTALRLSAFGGRIRPPSYAAVAPLTGALSRRMSRCGKGIWMPFSRNRVMIAW